MLANLFASGPSRPKASSSWEVSNDMALFGVKLVMCGRVLLRWIHDLSWLNATANAFMILAIATATIAGLIQFVRNQQQQQNDNNDNWQDSPHYPQNTENDDDPMHSSSSSNRSLVSPMSTFVADMFFASKGIGLVLLVENSFSAGRSTTMTTTRTTPTRMWPFFVFVPRSSSRGVPMPCRIFG